jgi:hypothetical protein
MRVMVFPMPISSARMPPNKIFNKLVSAKFMLNIYDLPAGSSFSRNKSHFNPVS